MSRALVASTLTFLANAGAAAGIAPPPPTATVLLVDDAAGPVEAMVRMKMKRPILLGAAMLTVLFHGTLACAGVYSDDLSKCLVRSASAEDKNTLMQWFFAALSTNPAVSSLSSVTAGERQALARKGADLIQRLVITDCHKETVDALKYEGTGVFETSFRVLGEVATRGLMSDPTTQAEVGKLGLYIDRRKWSDLAKEAGVSSLAPAPDSPKE